jgi:hypothetical protein
MNAGSTEGDDPMAKGQRPDFDVFISQKGANDKNFYTKIGAAWNVTSDGISIKLTALPLDGSLVLFPPKEE